MSHYARISPDDAHTMITERDVSIVDVRDAASFASGHITRARHLDDNSLPSFIEESDDHMAVIVCCYHGNMSQQAGAFLAQNGFAEVYSLDGGYAEWAERYPEQCET